MVLVCGSRTWKDRGKINAVLDGLDKNGLVILTGGCRGADRLAMRWALDSEIPFITVPAQWKLHGRGAGPRRNTAMLNYWNPEEVIGFGDTTGTLHMLSISKMAGLPVKQIVP